MLFRFLPLTVKTFQGKTCSNLSSRNFKILLRSGAVSNGSYEIPARQYYKRPHSEVPPASFSFLTVDLRSDTVTKPGAAMRRAMAEAEVGDDVFGEDPTVNELQRQMAELLGTEDTLFVPSGTMGNLISVMCHCSERGAELLVGDESHIHLYEQGGTSQLAGVHPRTLMTLPDGTFDLNELEYKICHNYPDPHYPRTCLICLESTHNMKGGCVLPLSFFKEIRTIADKYKLAVHLDGARLLNAAVSLNIQPSEIVQYCDSVMMCFSKAVGAPVGSIIGGSKDFIQKAVRMRKALGGGMRQVGVLAAAALEAMSDAMERLKADHLNARRFAEGILTFPSPLLSVDLTTVQTNIVKFKVEDTRISPEEFCKSLQTVTEADTSSRSERVAVLMSPYPSGRVRAVWHHQVSAHDTDLTVQKVKYVTEKYKTQLLTS
ncbi:probable low-specificity L-threonine aldolase 2 isoform X2 [Protopterus annectens]|uniref:probable low-specificity L-threonine aldolase 2 isoform X2 n=1 Tax=Protopterus annectens TaxID=7888 RepID=UPI001CFC0C85|nr:probable low-specificity L-threonine aldolase 2 isoform X2 [Protopterus annectens]